MIILVTKMKTKENIPMVDFFLPLFKKIIFWVHFGSQTSGFDPGVNFGCRMRF